ncbi:YciI family protein [Salinicoccus sp. CNSTN-B1]
MKYFAALSLMKDEEKSKQYREQHLEFIKEKREEGSVLMFGRFTDGAGGLSSTKVNQKKRLRHLSLRTLTLCTGPVISNSTSGTCRQIIQSAEWRYRNVRSWLKPSRPGFFVEIKNEHRRWCKTIMLKAVT